MNEEITEAQFIKAGGKYWIRDDKNIRRVYFNDLAERIGLETSHYRTGNISSASLNGESISNCSARKILGSLCMGKVWYDLNTKEFHSQNLGEYEEEILSSIKADLGITE